jgi:hypothetical protein
MNSLKRILTFCFFAVITSLQGQTLKVRILFNWGDSKDSMSLNFQGRQLSIDSIAKDSEGLFLCDGGSLSGPRLRDTIKLGKKRYIIVLLQKRIIPTRMYPVEHSIRIPDFPDDLPDGFDAYIKAYLIINGINRFYYDSHFDLICLAPLHAKKKKLSVTRYSPAKYRRWEKKNRENNDHFY